MDSAPGKSVKQWQHWIGKAKKQLPRTQLPQLFLFYWSLEANSKLGLSFFSRILGSRLRIHVQQISLLVPFTTRCQQSYTA